MGFFFNWGKMGVNHGSEARPRVLLVSSRLCQTVGLAEAYINSLLSYISSWLRYSLSPHAHANSAGQGPRPIRDKARASGPPCALRAHLSWPGVVDPPPWAARSGLRARAARRTRSPRLAATIRLGPSRAASSLALQG